MTSFFCKSKALMSKAATPGIDTFVTGSFTVSPTYEKDLFVRNGEHCFTVPNISFAEYAEAITERAGGVVYLRPVVDLRPIQEANALKSGSKPG
ncbi:MAG: hypothetical protein WCD70_14665 [Alphaproteobacteria bacterium]